MTPREHAERAMDLCPALFYMNQRAEFRAIVTAACEAAAADAREEAIRLTRAECLAAVHESGIDASDMAHVKSLIRARSRKDPP